MDSLSDQICFDPLVERLVKIKDKYADSYPIVLYEPNIEYQEKQALKNLIKGNSSIKLFSGLKEALKFVQSINISFILIVSGEFDGKTVIEDFQGSEKIYGRRLFDFEEEELSKDLFNSEALIKSLGLKAFVFISLLDFHIDARVDENEEDIMVMCDLEDMAKEFRQDFIVIWHDSKINLERKRKLEKEIGMKIEESDMFIDFTELYQRLQNYTGPPYHLIFSGREKAEELIKEMDTFKDLLGLYIYDCLEGEKIVNERIEIGKTLEELIPKIKENLRRKSKLINTFPSFATNFDSIDKSHLFYLHYYLKGLINFKNRKQAKRDFIQLAKKIYHDSNEKLMSFDTEYNEYDGEKILHWYTRDSPVYKLLNNCLRIASSDSILYSRLVFRDMEEAIKERYKQNSKDFNGCVYRGAYISTEEWEKLERNIGEEIEMYGFLSTTRSKKVAKNFFQGDPKNKVFITIIVPPLPVLDEQGFADISEFSDFSEEKEILFNVRSKFKILEANKGTQGRHLVLLYGARSLRKYMTERLPITDVGLQLPSKIKCSMCMSVTRLFAFHQGVTKIRCLDCLIKKPVPRDTPFFPLGSENHTQMVKSFKGRILRFNQALDLPYYGYKCSYCEGSGKSQYFRWIDMEAGKNFVQCSDCFKNKKETGCRVLLAESSPYVFWQEYQAEWEKADANIQREVSEIAKHQNQGKVYDEVQRSDLCLEYEKKSREQIKGEVGEKKKN